MGKKNIQPNSSQPVFRSLVARPALAELREENLTITGQTREAAHGHVGIDGRIEATKLHIQSSHNGACSFDGDDE